LLTFNREQTSCYSDKKIPAADTEGIELGLVFICNRDQISGTDAPIRDSAERSAQKDGQANTNGWGKVMLGIRPVSFQSII
jgi:hypothetical protein